MEKRKCRRVNVKGVVVAVSHLLLPPVAGFFVKIIISQPLCIRVRIKEHFQWLSFLKVGVTYRFSQLDPVKITSGAEEEVQFVDASADSTAQECQLALPKSLQDIVISALSYQGTVTDDSLSSLGLYQLEKGFMLCTSFIAHKACIETFKCLDPIIVYNAHYTKTNGSKYYIMCARSHAVSQPGNLPTSKDSSTLHPVIAFALEKGLCFDELLWLTTIFSKLKKLLDQKQIQGNETNRKHVFEVLNHLLFNGPSVSDSSFKSRSLMKEFLLNDHGCPSLVARNHPNLVVITSKDCHDWSKTTTYEKLWFYNLHHIIDKGKVDRKQALVGRLNVEGEIPRLVLSDEETPICCVFIGDSGCCSQITQYIGKTLIVRKATVVVEQFKLSNAAKGIHFEKDYVYVLLSPIDMYPVCSSLENAAESSNVLDFPNIMNDGESHNSAVQNVQRDFFSQRLLINHVSTPVIYDNEKQFYCLVSLLGQPVESTNAATEISNEKGRLCLLCMKKNLLKYHPFLFENRVYEIKYPSSYGIQLFNKRTNFPALASGAVFLPFTSGVIIPFGSSILGPFTLPNLPSDSIINKEIYRIRDAKDVEFHDVIHLQGIVAFRSHQDTKYPRKRKINDDNYGIPVEQNIILELRDEESDETIRIYLIAYAGKLYPLGLLPGSRVCLKFMEKKVSANNKHFYQSTCFTSVKLLGNPEVSPKSSISEGKQSLDSSKRHSFIANEAKVSCNLYSPFWGIFSITKIWKFEVLPRCRTCNSLIQYGRCTYVGCSYILRDPLITANANFLVEDGSGEAYMSAKDENVRKILGFCESGWKELGMVSTKKRVLFDKRKCVEQQSSEGNDKSIDQIVFNRLCSQVELKPWHILCRKFPNEEGRDMLSLFCLDVEEIDLERAELLTQ
ncbi:CST complex subunit CTC1-like [Hetaerina americana]|uniref:CST complex subunit CTC1-like n=1 Tax=Hetaerina americana TaxID=62018 RepID=UPI003A7F36DC